MTEGGKLNGKTGGPDPQPDPIAPTSPKPEVVYGAGLASCMTCQALERRGLPHPPGPQDLEGNWGSDAKASSNHPQTKTQL
eukprot:3298225-Pyramimonas_sp.AAC.1